MNVHPRPRGSDRRGHALLAAALAASLVPAWLAAAEPVSVPAAPTPSSSTRPQALYRAASTVIQPTHALTADDLHAWLDGMLPAALKGSGTPGAVVSVVKDGRLLLAQGYGVSDVAARTAMDPEHTLVRPGSISKLFTWTAVMQLVEAGELDPNADVNRYLDFRIAEPYGRPVTLNDLMTHRGGFEEGLKDAVVTRADALEPLGVFLKRHARPELFPPGEVPAYSNYGAALAGYIVERVSGERYEDYVARHILRPLGMARSTFAQPLPATLPPSVMSHGYMDGSRPPGPFELISFAPAGALTTTADDMARFMLAHLGDGRLDGASILRPQTVERMHSPSLPAPPGFDVMAHGFFRLQRNGRMALEHGGDSILFHSDLLLLPTEQVGLFVSFNARGRDDAAYGVRERLVQGFLDRYFAGPVVADPPVLASARADAAKIAGRYESSRRVQSGFMSLFYVLQGQESITAEDDGSVTLSSAPAERFREIAPSRWRQAGGDRTLLSSIVAGVPVIQDSRDPVGVLQRTPLRRNAKVNGLVFVLSFLVLATAAAAWAMAEGARRAYHQPPALTGRAALLRRLARIAVVADLLYLFAWFSVLKPILGQQVWFYTAALDPVVALLEVAALVPLLGVAAGVAHAAAALHSPRGWAMKAGAVAGAAALTGVAWVAFVGGLMTPTLNY